MIQTHKKHKTESTYATSPGCAERHGSDAQTSHAHATAARLPLTDGLTLLPIQTGELAPRPVQHHRHSVSTRLQRFRWASARLGFYTYIGFSMLTLVGGFVTAPLMSHLFFGDWRFWRYWRRGRRMLPHGWRLFRLVLRGESQYMLSVPLTSPPQRKPDHSLVELSPTWSHGAGCGSCQRCCHVMDLRCPVLDTETGYCSGYNSFYWRYFNCGRYPTRHAEIEYYGCPKWQMRDAPSSHS
jgi:hypothetical protein